MSRRNLDQILFSNLLQCRYIWRISEVNSSLEVTPRPLYRVEVWALTAPFQKVDFLFLKPFHGGFTSMFRVIVLLRLTASTKPQLVNTHHRLHIENWTNPSVSSSKGFLKSGFDAQSWAFWSSSFGQEMALPNPL